MPFGPNKPSNLKRDQPHPTLPMPRHVLLTVSALVLSWTLSAPAQTSAPRAGARDPFAPKGHRASADGHYAWSVRNGNPIRYVLSDVRTGKRLTEVDSSYAPEGKLARAAGFYWNAPGNLTVLDELNYRRAGEFYVFQVVGDRVTPIDLQHLIVRPSDADEARLTTEPPWDETPPRPLGWLDAETLSVRQAVKHRDGTIDTRYFAIKFKDPLHPTLVPE